MQRITKYFDNFRKANVKLIDDELHHVFTDELSKYQYCRDVPKGTLRMILSRLANGQSGTLSSDQEDDIMRALTHNSVHDRIDLEIWKNCLKYWTREDISTKSALIVVDVQNDFISGTLALKNLPAKQDGEDAVPVINKIKQKFKFDLSVLTMDWHPSNHCSYHVNVHKYPIHETSKIKAEEANVYDVVVFDGDAVLEQTLWPVHCEQESWGAKLHADLKVDDSDILIRKGNVHNVDSYSAFWDNGKYSTTELFVILMKQNISQVFICGLATDFCVLYSAVDSAEHGFQTYVIEDACKGVSNESIASARKKMVDAGVKLITADQVADFL